MRFYWLSILFTLSGLALADNNTNSNWTVNVSEGGITPAPRWPDNDPEIAVSGSTVHVIWFTEEQPANTYAIYYRRSQDNGKTWNARVRLYAQPQNLLLDGGGVFRKLAVDNSGVLHVAVAIHVSGPGALVYLRSGDGGTTWDAPKTLISGTASLPNPADVRVSTDGVKTTVGLGLQCAGCASNSYTLATTADGGKTFSTTVAFNDNSEYHNLIDMKRASDRTYLLYSGTDMSLAYGKMYVTVAPDSGSPTTNLASIPAQNGIHRSQTSVISGNWEPRIAVTADKAYVAWYGQDANGVERLFFRRFSNHGATMDPAIPSPDLAAPVAFSGPPQASLAASGGSAFLVYLLNTGQVFLRRYDESTGVFTDPQLQTTNGTWVASGTLPIVMAGTQNLTYIMWRNGDLTYSTDGFQTHVLPLTDSPPFTWMSSNQWSMATGANGSVYWVMAGKFNTYNNGQSDNDIFFNQWSPSPQAAKANMALAMSTSSTPTPGRYDGMQIPAGPGSVFTDAMSAAVWVQAQTGGINCNCYGGNYQSILMKTALPGFPNSYYLGTVGPEGSRQWAAQITTQLQTYELRSPANQPMIPGQWTHLAFTYDDAAGPNNFILYVNGQVAAQMTAAYPLNIGDGALFLGTQGNWTVDDLSFWNRALAPSEIQTVMSAPLSGAEFGLAAYYNFDDTTLALNNPAASGVLLYEESFVPSTSPSASHAALLAPSIAGIANIASYQLNFIAPASLASIYGSDLASAAAAVNVTVTDSGGTARTAQTFYQSTGRVDFAVPTGTAIGPATVSFTSGLQSTSASTTVSTVAPAIFTADQSGTGLAAGTATADLSDPNAQVYLILYGTGLRGHQQSVVCTIAQTSVPCIAVAQGSFVGLDQVNVGPLPQSLKGAGSLPLSVSVDTIAANIVSVIIN